MLALALMLPLSASVLAAGQQDVPGALLARIGATPVDCPDQIKQLFRPTVRLTCGSVDEELKQFKKTWKAATQPSDGTASGVVAATRWFRHGKQWRWRYYWMGLTPLLALFNVEDRRVVLASYDVYETCRERSRQLGLDFRETARWQQEGLILKRTEHVSPEFPEEARIAGRSGLVLLWGVVKEDGAVGSQCVVVASPRGYGFEVAAMEAVGQWVYEPVMQDERPVPVELLTIVTFELSSEALPYRALFDPLFSKP